MINQSDKNENILFLCTRNVCLHFHPLQPVLIYEYIALELIDELG